MLYVHKKLANLPRRFKAFIRPQLQQLYGHNQEFMKGQNYNTMPDHMTYLLLQLEKYSLARK